MRDFFLVKFNLDQKLSLVKMKINVSGRSPNFQCGSYLNGLRGLELANMDSRRGGGIHYF